VVLRVAGSNPVSHPSLDVKSGLFVEVAGETRCLMPDAGCLMQDA